MHETLLLHRKVGVWVGAGESEPITLEMLLLV
jgi:hypothetical protein